MRIPLTRRLAYAFKKLGYIFNPCVVAHKLECIGAPESVIDIKTNKPAYEGDNGLTDYFELVYGLHIVGTRSWETETPGVYNLTLYVAPYKHKIPNFDFLYGADSCENSQESESRADSGKK